MGRPGLNQGNVFGGRYRVVRCIASGGMGSVYEVVHLETDRRRALKTMFADFVRSPDLRERFQREARITANVVSEFIVEVFDAGVDAATGMPFLVMELLDGEDLGQRLQRLGRVGQAEVVTWLGQVGSALDKTHAAGIVHRDLKPENLFLTQRDDGSARIKILDFGISKVVNLGSPGGNATTNLGSPLYMAPEQITSAPLSAATDLFALALIAYTLLVGEAYWQHEAEQAGSLLAFAMKAGKGPRESAVVRARSRGVALPPAFGAWFRRATECEPKQRFQSASELVSALATALSVPYSGANLGATPWAASATVKVAARGRRWRVALLLGAALGVSMLAGYRLVFGARGSAPTSNAEQVRTHALATAPLAEAPSSPTLATSAPSPAAAAAPPLPSVSASVVARASASAVPSAPPRTPRSPGSPLRPRTAPVSSPAQPKYTRD